MRRFPVADEHKVECEWCYGIGCLLCNRRGWVESEEGREEREEEEDRRADAYRKGELE